MTTAPKLVRCAIYTRKSTEHNLDLEFNSLHAQREACEAYIKSQLHEGWRLHPARYDDGAFSGGTLDRPDLQRLLADIRAKKIDNVVVYKVDRLTRSLTDFAKLVELFDANGVFFVSVTQAFNTTNSMGRLTLNVLLSFAQFEREVIAERVRDKVAASKRKGMWMGGGVPLGYINRGKKRRGLKPAVPGYHLIFAVHQDRCVEAERGDAVSYGTDLSPRMLSWITGIGPQDLGSIAFKVSSRHSHTEPQCAEFSARRSE